MKKKLAEEWKTIHHVAKNGIPEYLKVNIFIMLLSSNVITSSIKNKLIFYKDYITL